MGRPCSALLVLSFSDSMLGTGERIWQRSLGHGAKTLSGIDRLNGVQLVQAPWNTSHREAAGA